MKSTIGGHMTRQKLIDLTYGREKMVETLYSLLSCNYSEIGQKLSSIIGELHQLQNDLCNPATLRNRRLSNGTGVYTVPQGIRKLREILSKLP